MGQYGLVSWAEQEKKNTGNKDFKRFKFVNLKDGDNELRVITAPRAYSSVKFKTPGDKGYGKKVKTVAGRREECPTYQAGFMPKTRYYCGVIDRTDGEVKILEFSILIKGKFEQLGKNARFGNPEDYDVSITKDSNADPNNYYGVIGYAREPLSESDLKLRDENVDELVKVLDILSAPLAVEQVEEKMSALGYKGGVISDEVEKFLERMEERKNKKAEKSDKKGSSDAVSAEEANAAADAVDAESSDDNSTNYDFSVSATA